jgi:uncharacterized protein YhjY with autotransporter beta-barrel domain
MLAATPPPASAAGPGPTGATARPDPSQLIGVVNIVNRHASASRSVGDAQTANVHARLRAVRGGDSAACASAAPPRPAPAASVAGERKVPAAELAVGQRPAGLNSVPLAGCSRESGLTSWTAGAVEVGTWSTAAGERHTGLQTRGLTFGVDGRTDGGLTVGVALGVARERTEAVDALASLAYFTYRPTASWFVDGLAGYGGLKLPSERAVDGVGNLTGERAGSEWLASLTAGFRGSDAGRDFASFVRLDAAQATLRAFTENEAPGESLQYQRHQVPSLSVVAGAEASSRVGSRFGVLTPRGRIELRHELDRGGLASVGYADDRSGAVYGTPTGGTKQNSLSMSLDATLALSDGWSIGSGYRLELSNSGRASRVDLRLRHAAP